MEAALAAERTPRAEWTLAEDAPLRTEAALAAAEAALTLSMEATLCAEAMLSIEAWLWISATISTTAKLLAAAALSTATRLWTDMTLCRATLGIGVIVSVVVEVVELFVEFPPPRLPTPGMKPMGIALSPYPVPLGRGGNISVVPLPESTSQIA